MSKGLVCQKTLVLLPHYFCLTYPPWSLQVLVRRCADGTELRGRIVETEAYLGGEDAASHSAGGKRTERNTAMFMKPGTIYVYPIYGIYLCMNVSSEGINKIEAPAYKLRILCFFFMLNLHSSLFSIVSECEKVKRKETEWSLADCCILCCFSQGRAPPCCCAPWSPCRVSPS